MEFGNKEFAVAGRNRLLHESKRASGGMTWPICILGRPHRQEGRATQRLQQEGDEVFAFQSLRGDRLTPTNWMKAASVLQTGSCGGEQGPEQTGIHHRWSAPTSEQAVQQRDSALLPHRTSFRHTARVGQSCNDNDLLDSVFLELQSVLFWKQCCVAHAGS